MERTLERIFLDFSAQKLEQLFTRINDSLDKLTDQQAWQRGSENENAIGNLVLHLSGNVRQWIVSGIGGQPDIRVRDREFSTRGDVTRQELIERLRGVLNEAVPVIQGLTADRLLERVTIQKYELTVAEAVFHVVEHFSQHTGQILFAVKAISSQDLGFYRHLSGGAAHGEKTP